MWSIFCILGSFLVIGSFCGELGGTGKLPSDIPLCKPGDVVCIAKVATDVIQNNPNGRSDLGLPKIEPFRINKLVISEGNTGGLSLKLSFKDLDIIGLSKATIDKVVGFEEDPIASKFEMSTIIPSVSLKGKYTADGKILGLPIQGNGEANLILENVRISCKLKHKIETRDGHMYLGIEKFKTLVEPSRMTILSDSALPKTMLTFLNENWKDVWTELSSPINEAIGEIIQSILNNIFKTVSYDNMFKKA